MLEEQHSRELSMIVKELLPEPKKIVSPDRPTRSRRVRVPSDNLQNLSSLSLLCMLL